MNAIGIDLGTTTICATVLDVATGRTIRTVTTPSDCQIAGQPWESLQHPDMIVGRAADMAAQLCEAYAPIASIGLTGQMHGMLYLDASGEALSPLYTWQDRRCDQIAPGSSESYAERLSRSSGYAMATGFGAATHNWHVLNDCVPEGAVCFATIQDYFGMKLTGRSAPLTHGSNAASLGLYDAAAGAFDPSAIVRAGLDPSFFPQVVAGEATLGRAERGIPVSVAIGDNQAGYIGSVRGADHSVMISVGTSGQVTLTGNLHALPADVESRPLNGGQSILVGASLCGGCAYAKFERSCTRASPWRASNRPTVCTR